MLLRFYRTQLFYWNYLQCIKYKNVGFQFSVASTFDVLWSPAAEQFEICLKMALEFRPKPLAVV